VGGAHAAELLFTGRSLDGEEALRIGLVNRAVPEAEVLGAALDLAREIAAASPAAVRAAKRSLAASAGASLGEQLEAEAAAQALDYEGADLVEGLASARERRPPRFRDG
jgi:enoyl-CoA hydratase/carnithine racemase